MMIAILVQQQLLFLFPQQQQLLYSCSHDHYSTTSISSYFCQLP